MKATNPHQTSGNTRLIALIGLVILGLIWEFCSRSSENINFQLSRPTNIGTALLTMVRDENLAFDFCVTASEALAGTIAGTVLGSATGLALWLSRRASSIAEPFILMAGNFPVFALAPAAIVWLGIGIGMKIFLAAFATFFVALNLSHAGAHVAAAEFDSVFDGFRASPLDTYRKVIVPGALDAVFNSMRVNVGLGILGAFIGEFIASSHGLGRVIIRSSGLYQIDKVFAASLCIILLAFLFDLFAQGVQNEKLWLSRLCGLPRQLRVRTKELRRKS